MDASTNLSSQKSSSHWFALLVGGLGAGAALMYLFDPERGRGRRARLSDQLTSKAHRLGERIESRSRDLRNRAKGLLHETGIRTVNKEDSEGAAISGIGRRNAAL